MKYDVIALGEVLIDFVRQNVSTNLVENKVKTVTPSFLANPGGAPANLLACVSKMGYKTAFIGKVGQDMFGRQLASSLENSHISTEGLLLDDDFFTTLAFVDLDENGDRSFSFARKPGADTMLFPHEVNKSLLQSTEIFHFGSLSLTHEPARTSTREAIRLAQKEGAIISYDPNLRLPLWDDLERAKTEITWGLQQCNWLKISREECAFLWPDKDENAYFMQLFLNENIDVVLLTKGEDGATLASRKNRVQVTTPSVKPVDTTGAGDICGGAAHSKLLDLLSSEGELPKENERKLNRQKLQNLSTKEMSEICRFAVYAGSLSTESLGAIPSIPSRLDIEKKIAQTEL